MAFDEDPIVDNNSKNSEESVLFIKTIFSQRNGFICRTDIPDFGVDELIELMKFDENEKTFKGATNKRFVLQLKSIGEISSTQIIKKSNKDFIKLSFKSSRLNYLLQYSPAFGIIVIFDVSKGKGYYDNAEEVYKNLMEFNQGDNWKQKEKPTIFIPIENELNAESLSHIHNFFRKRHENAENLVQNHGQAYNIPSFKKPTSEEFDFRNPQDIKKVLIKYGWIFIDDNDLILLDSMLGNLSHQEIINDHSLCLLKATVSCETGHHLDADYFLSKYDQLDDTPEEETSRKLFLRNKIDHILGRISSLDFILNLKTIKESISDQYNRLLIDINIVFMELLQKLSNSNSNMDRFMDISILFDKIDNSEIDERKKYYLKNYHISNLAVFVTDYIREKLGQYKIKESMKISMPLFERGKEVGDILDKIKYFKNLSIEVWSYGSKTEDIYLVAYSMYNIANYQFVFNYNIPLLHSDNRTVSSETRENFINNINIAFSAYDLFSKIGKVHKAYLALILAHEFTLLFKILYEEVLNNEPALIEKNIKSIQVKMGYKPFESIVRSSINQLLREQKTALQTFQEIDDSNLDMLINTICDSAGLPEERKVFIKSDIISTKYFYANRKSEDLELFQNLTHTKSSSTLYKFPLIYSIHCKKCDNLTDWNTDIKILLKLVNDHKC